MIKAADLRIGNLIQCQFKPGGPFETVAVAGVHDKFISWTFDDGFPGPMVLLNEGYKPILLSEEWLQKMGFVDITDGYRATGQADPVFRVASPVRGQNIDLYRKWDNEAWKPKGYFLGHFEYVMQYVHQLQNLFYCLTGQELTIKETV